MAVNEAEKKQNTRDLKQNNPSKEEAAELKKGYLQLLLRVAVIAAVAFVVLRFVFAVIQVTGNDMMPAVKDGDLVIAFRLQKDYYQNDVVVYEKDGKKHVGRIVAVGGDIVKITEDGTLIVNGTVESGEIYFPTYPENEEPDTEFRIPEDCFYLCGDYRTSVNDSRTFGPVPNDEVIGKVITILRRRGI